MTNIREYIIKVTNENLTRPVISNFLAGLGIYHALYKEESALQVPLAVVMPSVYVGYHSLKNVDKIKEWIKG